MFTLNNTYQFLIISFIPIFLLGIIHTTVAEKTGGTPEYPLHNTFKNWFVYNLKAGESYTDTLRIFNYTDSTSLIKIHTIDGTSHNSDEDFLLKNKNEEMVEIGKWIVPEQESVIIPANSSILTRFTITIPNKSSSEEIKRRVTGGIILEDMSSSITNAYLKSKNKPSISINTQSAIRIYNTIPKNILE